MDAVLSGCRCDAGVSAGRVAVMGFNTNVTISAMYDLIKRVADFWLEHIKPTPFEATFYVHGVRVDVKVSDAEAME
jgi:hypothetical protein